MDKLFFNGEIITMKEAFDKERIVPEAVLVSDGLIKRIGMINDLKEDLKEDVEWIDLKGRCLMPSFIDSHSHIVMNGQMSLYADLSGCGSFEEIINTLKEYKINHNISNDGVIVGYGYDHNFLTERVHPDKYTLDKVSTTIPVIIMHISGHLLCANSIALEIAGITASTEEPYGGRIGRIKNSLEPNGYFEEVGLQFLYPVLQNRIQVDTATVVENMQTIYLENGVTTVQDGASTEENINLLKGLARSGQLKIDIIAYPLIADKGKEVIDKNKNIDNKYENHLKIGGYKIILDGSPQGRSAWLSEPYMGGDEKYCGYASFGDEIVNKYVEQAVKEKKQILAHCNGDAASEQLLNAYELCMRDHEEMALRPVMIHCQTVRNDQLERMAKMKMIASIFVGHVYFWGDIHLQNLGFERGNHISPVRDAIDRGVVVNFHQDTPVTKPNMLHSIWCAVNRISRNGVEIGKEQRISVYEALKAVTINAAYEYFEENEKGSLEEGKRADMVILSDSPLKVDIKQIKNIYVLETIKDGEVVFIVNDINFCA